MARVKIGEIVAHLDGDLRNSLLDAVRELVPDAAIDSEDLYRAFKRALARRFSGWVKVPEHLVSE